MPPREPPLLMNNCQINPDWERWLKTNYPNLSARGTNANVMLKMLRFRATIDIVLKESWNDYSEETLELLRECPEDWELLMTLNPPKPTMLQRFMRFIKR
jgi:hypothetical protein